MEQDGNGVAPVKWRIQILSEPPRLVRMGEEIPKDGWAIQEETSVFKDGEAVGLYASLTAGPRPGNWNLRYEWIGESPRTLLA